MTTVIELEFSVLTDTEGLVLTGGKSERMGSDKAKILVEGVPVAVRVATGLATVLSKVTTLGREPLEGFDFLADQEEYAGPASALRRFEPTLDFVFVAACDMPLFDSNLVAFLREAIGSSEAAIPVLDDVMQPLCGLYRRSAFDALKGGAPPRSMMGWLDRLDVRRVAPEEMTGAGVLPASVKGANTPEEFRAQISRFKRA